MNEPFSTFTPALAGVIAEAIEARRLALSEKSAAFNTSIRFAALTLFLVTCSRMIGGLPMTDSPPEDRPTAAPSTPASAAPTTPAGTLAPSDSAVPTDTIAPASPEPTTSEAEPLTFAMGYEVRNILSVEPDRFHLERLLKKLVETEEG
jgi:hypothetical protein